MKKRKKSHKGTIRIIARDNRGKIVPARLGRVVKVEIFAVKGKKWTKLSETKGRKPKDIEVFLNSFSNINPEEYEKVQWGEYQKPKSSFSFSLLTLQKVFWNNCLIIGVSGKLCSMQPSNDFVLE